MYNYQNLIAIYFLLSVERITGKGAYTAAFLHKCYRMKINNKGGLNDKSEQIVEHSWAKPLEGNYHLKDGNGLKTHKQLWLFISPLACFLVTWYNVCLLAVGKGPLEIYTFII